MTGVSRRGMVTSCDPELTVLTITNLDLSYPGHEPLATVSWQIKRGDQVALLSGAQEQGKSTLLAAIIEGSLAVTKDSDRIAYLSQQPALLPWATAIENVLLGFKLRGHSVIRNYQDSAQSSRPGRARHSCSSTSFVAQRRPKSPRRSCTRVNRTIRFGIAG